jgi:hypothetical protein
MSRNETEKVRARLRQAGLLAETGPAAQERPSHEAIVIARRQAGKGTSLAELVSQGRR